MKIRSRSNGFFGSVFFLAILLFADDGFAGGGINSSSSTPITGAGIYKGSYSSTSPNGDYGTVTIIVNEQGGTACDFHSTPYNYYVMATAGSVTSSSPYLALTCANAGISFAGSWIATTDSSSIPGKSLSGTWAEQVGPNPPFGGPFTATYVSAFSAIPTGGITGMWYQHGEFGGFNFLMSDAGLIVTFYDATNWQETLNGKPIGFDFGAPYWLISGVGPKAIFPGTAVTINMSGLPPPPSSQPTPVPAGSLVIVFFDCGTATAALKATGPIPADIHWNLQKLVGIADGPDC